MGSRRQCFLVFLGNPDLGPLMYTSIYQWLVSLCVAVTDSFTKSCWKKLLYYQIYIILFNSEYLGSNADEEHQAFACPGLPKTMASENNETVLCTAKLFGSPYMVI